MAGVARCALLWSGLLAASASAIAADMHDHGKAAVRGSAPGPVREVALPEGFASAQSIALDPAGRVWLAEKVGRKLAVYDPETRAFTVHSLPASWGNMGFSAIAAGVEGEIWFTVSRWAEGAEEPRLLGRFTPSDGYFTKFTLSNGAVPRELLVTARGEVWFLAANKSTLYRVDPRSFAVKGYPIPSADGYPRGLAADAKGRIWFADSNGNRIAVFEPEGAAFREYAIPTSFSNPGGLSIDRDGKVWFVEMTANRIGAFWPERKRFDEAIVPTPGSAPAALVNDDDGNVWFLEYAGNKVGFFNPGTAAFREYHIPTLGSLPASLVIDRKRALLWFTQSATEAKRLGMLSIREAQDAGAAVAGAPASGSFWRLDANGIAGWLGWSALVAAVLALAGGLAIWLRAKAR